MLDDMDSGVKILVIVLVVGVVLVLAVPLIVILAAVIASFVLGLGSEAALLLPVCGPGAARWLRSRLSAVAEAVSVPDVSAGERDASAE
jgi:hypothetical protein